MRGTLVLPGLSMTPTNTRGARQAIDARRRLCLAAAFAMSLPTRSSPATPSQRDVARSSHFPFGPVVPSRPILAWPVVTHEGRATDLAQLVRGRVSAVQLMFTGCSSTCPIQGALFAEAQHEWHGVDAAVQWISISIDPLSDTPAALKAWLRKFEAAPGWLAVRPRPDDVAQILELLGSGGESRPQGPDPHTGQVFIVDRRGNMVFRTPSLPPVDQIITALKAAAIE